MQMTNAQTVFTVFYAILYGAIFTVSDKWKPFSYAGSNNRKGLKRCICSLIMLVLIPVIYFIHCFAALANTESAYSILLVSPLYALYSLWSMYVPFNKDKFYSEEEQRTSPVKDSLFWIISPSPCRKYLLDILLIIIPLAITIYLTMGK